MSIVVTVEVSEGLVLAADSASTIFGKIGDRPPGVINIYDNARKLSHIGEFPVGVLSWGIGSIGPRNIQSFVTEFETTIKDETHNVKNIANGFFEFIKERYDQEFKPIREPKKKPVLGVLVCGYTKENFLPEQYRFVLPMDGQIHEVRPKKEGQRSNFGANWFGAIDAIIRLHKGVDPKLLNYLKTKGLDEQELSKVVNELEYPIVFDGMPLQDAIDFAGYLINIVIGRFRFVIGPPVCGGEIDVAVITNRYFKWIKRKEWKVNY